MRLTGLPLSMLLAFGAAAAVVLVALYVMKLRRRSVPVAFSGLWERVLGDRRANVLFSRLKQLLSLLVQLAVLALLIFALADPRLGDATTRTSRVVLLDVSASMQATDVEPSRLDQAKREVEKLIDELGIDDALLLVEMGSTPRPVSAFTGKSSELHAALSRVQPTDARADIREALRFSRDVLSDRGGHREIVLISDGGFAALPSLEAGVGMPGGHGGGSPVELGDVSLRFIPINAEVVAPNLGVTAFSARRYPLDPARAELHVAVQNSGDQTAVAQVEVTRDDDSVVSLAQYELAPAESRKITIPDLSGIGDVLTATIRPVEGRDPLPADDAAYVVLTPRPRPRVLLVTTGNLYLQAALLLDDAMRTVTIAPTDARPTGDFDVVIFDGAVPAWASGASSRSGASDAPNKSDAAIPAAIYIDPPADASPVPLGEEIEMFGFDRWDRKSPMLRSLALENVQVLRGHALKPAPADHVLGSSVLGPLLVEGERDGQRFVVLAFDPRDSDMVLRASFPLLVLNTVRHFDGGTVFGASSRGATSTLNESPAAYRTGERWSVPVGDVSPPLSMKDPAGTVRRIAFQDGVAQMRGELAGVYEISDAKGVLVRRFAANLADRDETLLRTADELPASLSGATLTKGGSESSSSSRHELWLYLLAAVLVVSVVEWITYHRRVTV